MSIERQIEISCELEVLNKIIETQKKLLKFLQHSEWKLEKELDHLHYRERMERKTAVKVETKGEL